MTTQKKLYDKMIEADVKLKVLIGTMEHYIQERCDVDIFIENFPGEGCMVMIEGSRGIPVGEPLHCVLKKLDKKERLKEEDFNPIG